MIRIDSHDAKRIEQNPGETFQNYLSYLKPRSIMDCFGFLRCKWSSQVQAEVNPITKGVTKSAKRQINSIGGMMPNEASQIQGRCSSTHNRHYKLCPLRRHKIAHVWIKLNSIWTMESRLESWSSIRELKARVSFQFPDYAVDVVKKHNVQNSTNRTRKLNRRRKDLELLKQKCKEKASDIGKMILGTTSHRKATD